MPSRYSRTGRITLREELVASRTVATEIPSGVAARRFRVSANSAKVSGERARAVARHRLLIGVLAMVRRQNAPRGLGQPGRRRVGEVAPVGQGFRPPLVHQGFQSDAD